MRKRYMDFVPTSSPVKKPAKVVRELPQREENLAAVRTVRTETQVANTVGFASEGPNLGMVEDLNERFVKTDVPKRPLGGSGVVASPTTNYATANRPAPNAPSSVNANVRSTGQTYRPPKNPFINQGAVQKRPLSKNVYQKPIAVQTEEKSDGPVTIIAKPEKQAHVSLIVTIIITIILGAAAGTVAFLLLPK